MKLPHALIGHTGFVGSNLAHQHHFELQYNSHTISESSGKQVGILVCAGAPGTKWLANKDPESDWKNIQSLMESLSYIRAQTCVLISTIDVYSPVDAVNENSPINVSTLTSYGKHRRLLEQFVTEHFNTLVIRLPGIFGNGLKKNVIYDFMHGNTDSHDARSVLQFYSLDHLWSDIEKAIDHKLTHLNIATEPTTLREMAQEIFNIDFTHELSATPAYYDMQTLHAPLWNMEQPYLYTKKDVFADLKNFVNQVRTI